MGLVVQILICMSRLSINKTFDGSILFLTIMVSRSGIVSSSYVNLINLSITLLVKVR